MNQRSVKRYVGKISAWVLCMAMIFTMTFVPTFAETEVDSTTVEESSAKEDVVMEIEGEELRGILAAIGGINVKYKTGTFRGQADAINGSDNYGTVILDVVTAEGKISEIKVIQDTKQSGGASFWRRAAVLLDRIKDANGTEGVSAVSHATASSNAIIKAVEMALKDQIDESGGTDPQPQPGQPQFKDGDGTADNPYQISNEDELVSFGKSITDGNTYEGKYLVLAGDINLTKEWKTAGSEEHPFCGNIDGKGYSISGLNIDVTEAQPETAYYGFFSSIAENSVIKDMTFADANVNIKVKGNKHIYAGVLAGKTAGRSSDVVIDRVNAYGNLNLKVSENWGHAGALIGDKAAAGVLSNCCTNVNITVRTDSRACDAGGICAHGGREGLTVNCAAYGDIKVSGKNMAGVNSCSAGGIMGSSGGMVYNCYYGGNLYVENDYDIEKKGLGGIFASAYAFTAALDCYFSDQTKFMSGSEELTEKNAVVNNLPETPLKNLKAVDSTPDKVIELMNKGLGADAKAEAAKFFGENFKFNDKLAMTALRNWIQDSTGKPVPKGDINDGGNPSQPQNPENIFAGGTGTADDPFRIETAAQLKDFGNDISEGNTYNGKFVILSNDIDLAGDTDIRPLGMGSDGKVGAFEGNFDGKKHVVSHFTQGTKDVPIKKDDAIFVGFFALISKGAVVKNLGLKDISINVESNTQVMAGGVVSQITGATVDSCYVTGYLKGNLKSKRNCFVAGISPYNVKGLIVNCWTNVEIRSECTAGNAEAGGITALSLGKIANCYSLSNISGWTDRESGEEGVTWMGGIAGLQAGDMANCYATGNVESDTWTKIIGVLAGNTSGISMSCYNYFNTEARVRNADTVQDPVVGFGLIIPGGVNEDGVKFRGAIAEYNEGMKADEMSSDALVQKLNANFEHFPINPAEFPEGVVLKKWHLENGVVTFKDEAAQVVYKEIPYSLEKEVFSDGTYYGRAAGTKGYILLTATVAGGEITEVRLVSHEEAEGFADRAAPLLEEVKREQGALAVNKTDNKETKALKAAISSLINKVRIGDKSNYEEVDKSKIFAGGSGTVADPYKISTVEQLKAFAASVNDVNNYDSEYIILTNDIDLSDNKWIPVGGRGYYAFCGIFDGKGHSIKNMTMGSKDEPESFRVAGLFTTLSGATVKNLNLKDVSLNIERNDDKRLHIGAVAGQLVSDKTKDYSRFKASVIDNCTVTGKLNASIPSSFCQLGGIAGYINESIIMNCGSDVDLSAKSQAGSVDIGGIAGINAWNILVNNFAYGSINADSAVESASLGGISGMNAGVSVNNYSNISIISKRSTGDIGGVAGRNTGIGAVYNSYFNSDALQKSGNTVIADRKGVGVNVTSMGAGIVDGVEGRTSEQMKSVEFAQLMNGNLKSADLKSKYKDKLKLYAKGNIKLEGRNLSDWVLSNNLVVLSGMENLFSSKPGSNHSDSDLNKDGKIDMQDLKIVQMNYRIVSSDPRWTDISKCDVNHDNVVDIQDLTDIMLKFA